MYVQLGDVGSADAAVAPYVASQRAMLAQELPAVELAPTREALLSGDIAPGHATAVTRTLRRLDRVPEVDPATWGEAQAVLVAEEVEHAGVQNVENGDRFRSITQFCPSGRQPYVDSDADEVQVILNSLRGRVSPGAHGRASCQTVSPQTTQSSTRAGTQVGLFAGGEMRS